MESKYEHLSDEELLLFADGELPPRRVSRVDMHLAACWDCRSRLRELEETIAEFVHVHHGILDPQLPPSTSPRALLKARLAEAAAASRQSRWLQPLERTFTGTRLAYGSAMLLVVCLGIFVGHRSTSPAGMRWRNDRTALLVPDRRLTPGVAHAMNSNEICGLTFSDDTRVVPASVRRKVFQEYGMAGTGSGDYELDYLISPQLGGTEDIRNLWPEPESLTVWNMRAKDDLEGRLQQLVCQGKVSLSTAQHDLATDWISAYKKYFHTDRPINHPS
ncbi:MAG: zf-HC2 domain-containing protein [Candidatus Korobacteraceae bacterium]